PIAISDNGHWFAVCDASRRTVSVWRLDSRTSILDSRTSISELSHDGLVNSLTFSPDARWLATSVFRNDAARIVRIWELPRGVESERLVYDSVLNSLAFSPDGRWLEAAADDGAVWIWDASVLRQITHLGRTFPDNEIAFSPKGEW